MFDELGSCSWWCGLLSLCTASALSEKQELLHSFDDTDDEEEDDDDENDMDEDFAGIEDDDEGGIHEYCTAERGPDSENP